MNIRDLRQDWDAFGKNDPMWAILTAPGKRGNKWQAEEFFGTGAREIEELMKYVQSLGVRVSKRKALDFGCGIGRLTQALADYFDEVHGVDVAPSMIRLACRYNRRGDKCRYHLNDSPSLSLFADDSFDLIYSVLTLQHIDPKDSRAYVKEFIRILAPHGSLIFQLPSTPANYLEARARHALATALLWLLRRIGYIKRPIMVIHGIKRQDVVRLVEESGGKLIDVKDDTSTGDGWLSFRYFVAKG